MTLSTDNLAPGRYYTYVVRADDLQSGPMEQTIRVFINFPDVSLKITVNQPNIKITQGQEHRFSGEIWDTYRAADYVTIRQKSAPLSQIIHTKDY